MSPNGNLLRHFLKMVKLSRVILSSHYSNVILKLRHVIHSFFDQGTLKFSLTNFPRKHFFLCKIGISGFPAVRENLENLEKGLFLEKVRENLEKSGNFCKIPQKSGKSQGISFQNALNLVAFSQSWNSYFQKFSCRTQPWWVLQIIIVITKISTLTNIQLIVVLFKSRKENFIANTKKSPFWSGKKGPFSSWVREKLPFFSIFVREKG